MRTWIVALGFAAFTLCPSAPAGSAPAGRVIGVIDGVSSDGDQAFLSGWACQQGRRESIAIHIFARQAASGPASHAFVTAGQANFFSEPAIAQRRGDGGAGQHRFFVTLPYGYGAGTTFYVNGIRVVNGVPNDELAGSGAPPRRLARAEIPFPEASVPPVAGTYRSQLDHPHVFTTQSEMHDLVTRINTPASYSAMRFAQLTAQVARDLTSTADWDAAYAGCRIGPYLYAFSYEPQDRHDKDTHDALGLPPSTRAPTGGAVVASRLALYAALVDIGAHAPAGAPNADRAAALAKRILLAWADHGFPRDAAGHFASLSTSACAHGGYRENFLGPVLPLQVGRGVVYSVDAQDLLESIGALDAGERDRLDAMHAALFDWIRGGLNQGEGSTQPECQRYANGTANGLAALLAIARLRNDWRGFDAVLAGGDRAPLVIMPWTRFIVGAIYGRNDRALACYPNSGPDGLHSGDGFTTGVVAAGEVQDRYRAGVLQTFGYPMFTLERLIDAAEVLRNAGYDPYGYRGPRDQSIEMAIDYYACYGKTPGFYATVSRENARACPNFEQYYGKVVNGVEQNVIFGAYRFPSDAAITSVEDAAKARAATGAFALDAILFGKWRG
ncbi:MAG: hypothetical protein JO225_01480 [Candidatus Eremiobacteraeota bacterium]|nr:hypothetical protein [Candidatus Eremiobacteraeota bacterium]